MRRSNKKKLAVLIWGAIIMASFFYHVGSVTHAAETINLRFATLYPQRDPMCYGPQFMFRELEKRTGGKVKVKEYYNQSLGKAPEMLDMLEKGIADIALINTAIFPNVFQTIKLTAIPGLLGSRVSIGEAMYELDCRGFFDKDLAGYKALIWEGTEPMAFGFADKKVLNLEDLQKLKIRGAGGPPSEFLRALGPSVVTIPSTDMYMALDRGVVDGICTMPGWFVTAKMYEVSKYWLWEPFGIGANLVFMTKARWNSLPVEVRAEISDLMPAAKYKFLESVTKEIPDMKAHLRKLGIDVYTLDRKERARWDSLLENAVEKMIADVESKGYPIREAVEAAKDINKRYE